MIRRLLLSLFVAAVLASAPVSTEAALITQCADATSPCEVIGTFSWEGEYVIGDGSEALTVPDLFTLVSTQTIEFNEVVLTLNTLNTSNPMLFFLPNVTLLSGWQTSSGGTWDLPGQITSAAISFSVLNTQFFAEFPIAPGPGESVPTDIYAVVPAPEPASLALLSIGLGALAARHRRQSKARTA